MSKTDYDAIVVGSGPNGLAAAINIQQQGLNVLLVEGKDSIGGGLRSKSLTLPGFTHDVCSAIHPMAVASPYFSTLPLYEHGLEYIYSPVVAAHPFDNGTAAVLLKSVEETATRLGEDEQVYLDLIQPVVEDWTAIVQNVLGPLSFPKDPLAVVHFGLKALTSATYLGRNFNTREGKGLWGGMTAHSIQPLSNLSTSAIGLVLMAVGHMYGWPIPKGGSQSIANALASYFTSIGGKIEVNRYVTSLDELPSSKAIIFDVTPKQLLEIAGHKFSSVYEWQLRRYRYGMGVFKIDWAIEGSIPFTAEEVKNAGTVHIGNTFEEIAYSEKLSSQGKHPDNPFVLLAQQSMFDETRAPFGKNTVWAYCHVPHGSNKDMTEAIEKQIERFAPGFRERILARNTMNAFQMQEYNPNYIGGDINGGVLDIGQLFTRPALRRSPYKTSVKGLYICSSSTPPGGGVHGMCGFHASRKALKEVFKISDSIANHLS